MASRRLAVNAVSNDVLSDQDIRDVLVPSVVNLWASSLTNGDQIGLRLDRSVILEDGELNTIATDVVDISSDQLVFNTVVGAGTLRVPVPTLTTELQLVISVEPIL